MKFSSYKLCFSYVDLYIIWTISNFVIQIIILGLCGETSLQYFLKNWAFKKYA